MRVVGSKIGKTVHPKSPKRDLKVSFILSAVGFEPTRSKTLRPERNPLDHSGKLTHYKTLPPQTLTNNIIPLLPQIHHILTNKPSPIPPTNVTTRQTRNDALPTTPSTNQPNNKPYSRHPILLVPYTPHYPIEL